MSKPIAVITGGGGFLGKALSFALIEKGFAVRAIQRGEYPELAEAGVDCFKEDLAEPSEKFPSIFKDALVVFHVAAKVDMWGDYETFYAANVAGTKNVLKASQDNGVARFVFTSSPSVIASASDLRGVDEEVPYPTSYSANYPKTKAEAERLVLAANSDSMYTCALRPHLIWGPGDTNLIPTILERAEAGKLVQVGDGKNVVDLTFIDDCVAAHLCAFEALESNPAARGKPYFISQGDPVPMWQWINQILKAHNLPEVTKSISSKLAYILAILFEKGTLLFPSKTPLFTRFLVEEMSTDHYFDISRAKDLLGFEPKYTIAEAMKKTFGSPSTKSH